MRTPPESNPGSNDTASPASTRVIVRHINDPELNRLTAPEKSLFRPPVSFARLARVAAFFIGSSLAISIFGVIAYGHFEEAAFSKTRVLTNSLIVFPVISLFGILFFLKPLLVQCVLIYQRYADSSVRLRCCLKPSCSDYALLAIEKYGPIIGCAKTIARLRRCHPPTLVDYP